MPISTILFFKCVCEFSGEKSQSILVECHRIPYRINTINKLYQFQCVPNNHNHLSTPVLWKNSLYAYLLFRGHRTFNKNKHWTDRGFVLYSRENISSDLPVVHNTQFAIMCNVSTETFCGIYYLNAPRIKRNTWFVVNVCERNVCVCVMQFYNMNACVSYSSGSVAISIINIDMTNVCANEWYLLSKYREE